MKLCTTVHLILLICSVCYVHSKPGRFKSHKLGGSSNFKGNPGLSMNKKRMILGAGGIVAAYIGFKMASGDDLYQHTVCEGRRFEVDAYGIPREYKYTVCPRNLRYCCRSNFYEGEQCCREGSFPYSNGQPRGTIFGSLFGSVIMVLGLGAVIYCCCCRRRNIAVPSATETTPSYQTVQQDPRVVTVGGFPPAFDHNMPTYPGPISKPGGDMAPPPYFAEPQSGLPPPPYSANDLSVTTTPTSHPGGVAAPGSGWSNPSPASTPYPRVL